MEDLGLKCGPSCPTGSSRPSPHTITCALCPDVSEHRRPLLQPQIQDINWTQPRATHKMYWVGIIIGLLFIIMCFSKGLKEGNNFQKSQIAESSSNNKKKDLSEEDMQLLARILSVGLVDADPNYLHHLKGYRDLHTG